MTDTTILEILILAYYEENLTVEAMILTEYVHGVTLSLPKGVVITTYGSRDGIMRSEMFNIVEGRMRHKE